MKAGESEWFDCLSCNTEFEVTYEPKATPDSKESKFMTPRDVHHCPFCGNNNLESQDR